MSFFKKIALYYHTIKFLKTIQLYYRLYYKLRPKPDVSLPKENKSRYIFKIEPSIADEKRYDNGTFRFLNLEKEFKKMIDWNFAGHGKLWTYNLNYFEYLNQEYLSKETGLWLMNDFIDKTDSIRDGLEPFPVSLRLFNWMKFIIEHSIEDQAILNSLYAQYHLLQKNIEFHLLGNHLLENLFALLSGSAFFNEKKLFDKYSKLLKKQLDEQILEDGAHFELSPMYHQLMLFRALDTYNLIKHSPFSEKKIESILCEKISLMLGWLRLITFKNGSIPMVNDSAPGVAPSTEGLLEYADRLNIPLKTKSLSDSGYRKWKSGNYELLIDIGKIGPEYIPGHAHSDTFNFVLNVDNQELIVDTGISTYEKNKVRQSERGTAAHNTVQLGSHEQTEVWGGFRVGRRASVAILKDTDQLVKAKHDGYKRNGVFHERTFKAFKDGFEVSDVLSSPFLATSRIHFHPSVEVSLSGAKVFCGSTQLEIEGADNIRLSTYMYAEGYNIRKEAPLIEIDFTNSFLTKILTR